MQQLLELQNLESGGTEDEGAAARIARLRTKIPAPILAHYDRLRIRGKKGLVPLRNQVCAGCHMRQPIGVVMTLRHDQDIQLCESCDRYLYLPEETELAAPTPKPAPRRGRKRVRKSSTGATGE